MLIEIKSDVFRKKEITFHSGLNVILGDEKASNSIGKSNLLLIVDFIFGGEQYIKHSVDVIRELGHHEFYFCFKFDKKYKFKRATNDSKNIIKCNDNYEIIESISIDEFTKFLQEKYEINYVSSTFRSLVGLYLRIWGKNNYDMNKPLKTYENDSKEKVGIDILIKLFNKYNDLKDINDKIKQDTESKKTLDGMYKNEYAIKITQTQYKKNEIEIEKITSEIEDIKNNILKYVVNVEELIDKEILALKKEKNELLNKKNIDNNRLLRINRNLASSNSLSNKHLKKLQDFFPNANIKQINLVESFHKKIKSILASEIRKNKKELEIKVSLIENDIKEIDNKILFHLKNNTNPSSVVNKVSDLITNLNELKSTNKTYREKELKTKNIKLSKEELIKKSEKIIHVIKNLINKEMVNVNMQIYKNGISPIIEIETSKYFLNKPNDTGTGTSFMNLIIFDLAILKITKLPILAHDSILFKNIGNDIMENLIEYYNTFKKQIFISLDEHKKYSNVLAILEQQKIIKLDSENVLFIKKWSNKKDMENN